ncbi:beta-lactamase domain protein [Haladaptatus paucihalophilus DX253]|uniref:Beta-lactamase domain protein n=1 Tax=Haladaptatus paucihalophilus DX253 TaxID=797209 RepID=E7QV25_HALPU|nr:MBL fold metallo-hydrolase [Haladaptatus paucihalophilus]EFW91543.1 beta-lactamase domain protein [Haladaptatus paucihalophilus DX253]SHL25142.1 Glyoxylase, beta-lactamase superfamily II [Haladaptatus paucihalophilus DX253]
MSSNTDISPTEVAARLRDGDEDLYVLDVRNEDEYEEWNIDGSHNVPVYDQLSGGNTLGLEHSLDDVPEDAEVATVCVAGVVSQRAAQVLRNNGYDAKSMRGGMRGWAMVYQAYDVPDVDGVTQIVRPGTGCLSYVVQDGDEALVVDPGQHIQVYQNLAESRDLEIVAVADTHAHADHISGGRDLAAAEDVPYYLHEKDARELDRYTAVEDGDEIAVGERDVDVLFTPGHTRGSISFRVGDAALTGDTLFVRSVGRPDLEGGSDVAREGATLLFDSLDRLADLPDGTVALPGHFSDEEMRPLAATIGELEANNGLFGVDTKSEFVDTILEDLPDTPANYNRIKRVNTGKEQATAEAETLELGPNNCASN